MLRAETIRGNDMSFTTITNAERDSVGATTLPDQPTISASALKAKFDEPAKQLLVPKYNTLVGELEATTAAADLGASPVSGRTSGSTVQAVLNKLSTDLGTAETAITGLATDSHTHSNKAVIDKFNDTGSGLTYDGSPISGAVDSVNGYTGTIVLTASDVGALPSSTSIPSKTSDLTNDSGYITSSDLPTKTSDLTNDSGFITSSDLPTKTSDLTNDSGFITASDVPTKTSDLTNDSNFATTSDVSTAVATKSAVSWNQQVTTGQRIAQVTIDGTTTDVYAPTSGGGTGAVNSVNGQTGTVVLTASDVGALPSSTTIPTITDTYSGTSTDGMSGKAVKEALETLDVSDSAVSGQYVSAVSETDGKISVTRASLPSVPTVTDTYSSTSSDAMSGKAVNQALQTLDVSDSAVSGQYVSAVSETDGKISVTRASLPSVPTITDTYNSSSHDGMSGVAVASAVSGKANTSALDDWIPTSGTDGKVQSDNTVTFSGIDDTTSYGYDLYCENKLISITNLSVTNAGTSSMTLVYTVSGAATNDTCKLRRVK